MKSYKVIGIRPLNFKAQDGGTIEGTTIYYEYQEQGVLGVACDKVFASIRMDISKIQVGSDVRLSFTKTGRLDDIEILAVNAK